jgi:hypothetical protein
MGSLNLDSPSVQSYLQILQGVITRMATNSASAKSWCVGLVSAIVVIIANKGSPTYVWISVVPIVLFFSLDAYYLGLERLFRGLYNDFIRKLHEGRATVEDAFIVNPGSTRAILWAAARATLSFSIWPFYLLLIAMLVLVKAWVL